MTKKFTLLQLFSLVDGRLSTKMEDIYDMLDHICDFPGIMTHHLPTALNYVKDVEKPTWFSDVSTVLDDVRKAANTNDFEPLVNYIKDQNNPVFDIPQITDTTAFGKYLIDNSLLLRIGSKSN